jgi:hypothetical protein
VNYTVSERLLFLDSVASFRLLHPSWQLAMSVVTDFGWHTALFDLDDTLYQNKAVARHMGDHIVSTSPAARLPLHVHWGLM